MFRIMVSAVVSDSLNLTSVAAPSRTHGNDRLSQGAEHQAANGSVKEPVLCSRAALSMDGFHEWRCTGVENPLQNKGQQAMCSNGSARGNQS